MARYKHINTSPRLLPVDLRQQLQPGTFEHAPNYLLDHLIDLQAFDAEFGNDQNGAPTYPPAMLLKVVLFAYQHRNTAHQIEEPEGRTAQISRSGAGVHLAGSA